jgi:hypothetical protein
MLDKKALIARIAQVAAQPAVYFDDLASARKMLDTRAVAQDWTVQIDDSKSAIDHAIDGVAWHVFNTLRGTDDNVPTRFEQRIIDELPVDVPVEWATFEDVRALVAEAF